MLLCYLDLFGVWILCAMGMDQTLKNGGFTVPLEGTHIWTIGPYPLCPGWKTPMLPFVQVALICALVVMLCLSIAFGFKHCMQHLHHLHHLHFWFEDFEGFKNLKRVNFGCSRQTHDRKGFSWKLLKSRRTGRYGQKRDVDELIEVNLWWSVNWVADIFSGKWTVWRWTCRATDPLSWGCWHRNTLDTSLSDWACEKRCTKMVNWLLPWQVKPPPREPVVTPAYYGPFAEYEAASVAGP